MKNKMNGWICGLLPGEREYKINGVTYIVSARFEDSDSDNSIRSRFEEAITNEMIDLMDHHRIVKWQRNMCIRLTERRLKCSRRKENQKQKK